MELATLTTETVKLSDDSHRSINAGHPEDAKEHLAQLYLVLGQNHDLFKAEPEPEPPEPSEPPAPQPASDGD